jgi:hypothetical protein
MRTMLAGLVVVAIAAIGNPGVAANAARASHPATAKVVVHPVTTTGHARAGFAVQSEPGDTVDCSFADPSPGALSRNIEFCSPSAAYAIACWKSATAHHVLCMRDPTAKKLVKLPRTGKFASTARAHKAQRAPLLIVLGDGTRCSIRDGGAWGTLQSHPNWAGSYSCDHHGVVWTPPNAKHNGVNESTASWTVRTAPASGQGQLVTRRVKRAYFVS